MLSRKLKRKQLLKGVFPLFYFFSMDSQNNGIIFCKKKFNAELTLIPDKPEDMKERREELVYKNSADRVCEIVLKNFDKSISEMRL